MARTILLGIHDINSLSVNRIANEIGIQRASLKMFLTKENPTILQTTLEKIQMYIWRKLHKHELLSPEDFQ